MTKYMKGLFFVLAMTIVVLYGVNTSAGEKKEQRQLQPIYDYKAELKLTDEQVRALKENITSLRKEEATIKARLISLNGELKKLIETEGDIEQLKTRIKEFYDLQASLRITELVGSRKINSLLNKEQDRQWKEMRAADKPMSPGK